jgi:hypothetical protein
MIGIAVKRGSDNELTTSRPATTADNNKTYTNKDGSNVYITVEAGMPRGFKLTLVQQCTGSIGAIAGSGVTFTGDASITALSGQIVTVEWTATNTYKISLGQVPTNVGSTITPAFTMSRTGTGILNPEKWAAPCLVVFDATTTTDSATTDLFGDLLYSWDFGDTAKANSYWAYGARPNTLSQNRDLEPIAAHVYDTPGTYTITLTVLNASGGVNAVKQVITVTDPNTVFPGTNTICYSPAGDFSEALAGSQHATGQGTDLAAIINTYAATGKRLMLQSSNTYTAATVPTISDKIDGQITRFGTGSNPKLQPSAGTVASTLKFWEHYAAVDNWQIYGIDFANPGGYTSNIAVSATLMGHATNTINSTTGRILLYQCNTTGSGGFEFNGYGHGAVDCSIYSPAGTTGLVGIWGSNINMSAFIGLNVDNNNMGEHCIRIQCGQKYKVAYNNTKNPRGAKHCYTSRGSTVSQTAATWVANTAKNLGDLIKPTAGNVTGLVYIVSDVVSSTQHSTGATETTYPTVIGQTVVNGTLTLRAEYTDTLPYYYVSNNFCVHDNLFDTSTVTGLVDYATYIGPQGDANYEVIDKFIFRRNYFTRNASYPSQHSQRCLVIQASNGYVQNNIFNMDNVDAYTSAGVSVLGSNTAGIPTPSGIIVENNTFYSNYTSPTTNNYIYGVAFTAAGGTGMVSRNNLMYAPNAKGQKMVNDVTTTAVISNNTTDAQVISTNPFVSANPLTDADFKLATNSYAIGSGVALQSAYTDYFGTARSRLVNPDVGAVDSTS